MPDDLEAYEKHITNDLEAERNARTRQLIARVKQMAKERNN